MFENVQNHKLHHECQGKLEGEINSGRSKPSRGKISKGIFPGDSLFISASHMTGLNTRSMIRRSIIVGVRGGEGLARS